MKVSLGVMPDYAHAGTGLKIDSVIDLFNNGKLNKAIEKKLITGGLLNSRWVDVGTPERLNSLNEL